MKKENRSHRPTLPQLPDLEKSRPGRHGAPPTAPSRSSTLAHRPFSSCAVLERRVRCQSNRRLTLSSRCAPLPNSPWPAPVRARNPRPSSALRVQHPALTNARRWPAVGNISYRMVLPAAESTARPWITGVSADPPCLCPSLAAVPLAGLQHRLHADSWRSQPVRAAPSLHIPTPPARAPLRDRARARPASAASPACCLPAGCLAFTCRPCAFKRAG